MAETFANHNSAFWSRRRVAVTALVLTVLIVFFSANAHLVFVAMTSQPECVPHLKSSTEGAGDFIAAKSSC